MLRDRWHIDQVGAETEIGDDGAPQVEDAIDAHGAGVHGRAVDTVASVLVFHAIRDGAAAGAAPRELRTIGSMLQGQSLADFQADPPHAVDNRVISDVGGLTFISSAA